MFGNRKKEIVELIRELFYFEENQLKQAYLFVTSMFIWSSLYDYGISYSVYRYAQSVFLSGEQSSIVKWSFGNMFWFISIIVVHVAIILLVYFIIHKSKPFYTKHLYYMINSNIYIYLMLTISILHFIGGTSWLV